MASIQTLSETDRRTLARWAVACAERVLPLFDADTDAQAAVTEALGRAREYSRGRGSTAEEIARRLVAVKAAKSATTPAGAAAARAVGQAAAVAHMGAHALGAAAYSVKAVALANPDDPESADREIDWQLAQLTDAERMALRQLPPLGADASGPLGPGLLTSGVLGTTIRRIQEQIGSTGRARRLP